MTLTPCKECGEQIAKTAGICPKCGVRKPGRRVSRILAGILLLAAIGAIANTQHPRGDKLTDGFETARIRWVRANTGAAEAAVRRKLKDPESAAFRNVAVIAPEKFDPNALGIVCGEVNAKNSFGGYTGFSNFVSVDGLTFIEDGSRSFVKLWDQRCANGKPVWRV